MIDSQFQSLVRNVLNYEPFAVATSHWIHGRFLGDRLHPSSRASALDLGHKLRIGNNDEQDKPQESQECNLAGWCVILFVRYFFEVATYVWWWCPMRNHLQWARNMLKPPTSWARNMDENYLRWRDFVDWMKSLFGSMLLQSAVIQSWGNQCLRHRPSFHPQT